MSRGTIATAVTVAALAIGLSACGSLSSSDTNATNTSRGELTSNTTTAKQPSKDLPQPTSGVVVVDGDFQGTLTHKIDNQFAKKSNRNGVAVRVDERGTDDATGFADLCAGKTDVAVSSRRITDAELAACSANGLQVSDFAVAFDAIVIATENERDVGADCVNITQLREMFGAGSPVSSWNELNPNFYVLRIRPTGPPDGTPNFDYFGSRVLGVPDPTLANYISSYKPFKSEVKEKDYVSGRVDAAQFRKAGKKLRHISKRLPPAKRELNKADKALKIATSAYKKAGRQLDKAGRQLDAAVRSGDQAQQAAAEKVHSKAKRVWKRARHNYHLAKDRQATASKVVKRLSNKVDKAAQRQRRADRMVPPGAVGIFSFSFYELWEERLRPLEIDGQTGDRCVFPSEETISSELYPLERTIRLYTTTRSLRRPEVQTYIAFHLNNAADIARQLDLIPLPDTARQQELGQIRNPVATQSSSESQGTSTGTGTTSTTTTGASAAGTTTGTAGSATTTGETSTTTTTTTTTTATGGG